MTLLFRITLIVCALLVFIYVLRKIRHSELKIADSTFWFIFALVILLLAVFPHIAFFFSNIFGIESPSNCVFLAIIAILLVREFFTTVELSQLRNKVAARAGGGACRAGRYRERGCGSGRGREQACGRECRRR